MTEERPDAGTACKAVPYRKTLFSYVVSGFSRTRHGSLSGGARAFPPPLAGNPASFGDSPDSQRRQASGVVFDLCPWHEEQLTSRRR